MNATAVELARKEALMAMYRSVDRMNHHIANNNDDGVAAEVGLQINLRGNFEDLQEK